MPNSVRLHRWQPTRLPRPWDSPGKNTGVGCHFLLQCMKLKRESEVPQSCLTLHDPMDCSLPGSSVHGVFQARVLEWSAIAFSCKGMQKALKILFERLFDSSKVKKYKNPEDEDCEKCVELVLNLNVIHNVKNKRINNIDLIAQ